MYSTIFSFLRFFSAYRNSNYSYSSWCFRTVVLEKTLESPLDCKEIQSVNPKGNQSWIVIGRTVAEAEAPLLWHMMWRARRLPCSSVSKESACNTGDLGSIPGSGRSPGNPLKYSCLENPLNRGTWRAIVHRVIRVGYNLAIKPPPPWRGNSLEKTLMPERLKAKGEGGGIGWDG